ncbi:MAG: dipeptidase [Chloroflexaceae bacterium]|nr:dipeptidase [Chloroflexaceae bacterium]
MEESMTTTLDAAYAYAETHADRFVQELDALLRIPSLSGDPAHAGDVRRTAEWLATHMQQIGLNNAQVMETAGHPVVYGEWLEAGADRPTVLVYGHYDVVPAAMEDGWDTPPFEPVIKDGRIYARGTTDNKGQLFIHLKAFEACLQGMGTLPVNIKFLLEGEEEVSSPNLRPFIEAHLDLLRADVCVISDTSMRAIDEPAILHSLRGMTYIEVEVRGPATDLHSGFYGSAVHNPALALVEILAQLHNADHSIAVPGFYDDVVPLTDADRAMIAHNPLSEAELIRQTGAPASWGEAAYTLRERVTARPTLEINGLVSGWGGAGPKTIIPQKALAKISCRLVGNQNPHRIYELLKQHIESLAPPTVQVEVRLLTTGEPALIATDQPAMHAAVRAYERGWGATPIFTRGGGSIPIVADMYTLMRIPVVMMGYGLDDDGLHAPNESYSLEMFQRGINTAIVYLDELANLPH